MLNTYNACIRKIMRFPETPVSTCCGQDARGRVLKETGRISWCTCTCSVRRVAAKNYVSKSEIRGPRPAAAGGIVAI